jgi:hypothetical protein
MTEQFANFAQGILSAPITSGQTSISITPTDYTGRPAASNFPTQGNFRIVVQSFDVTTQIPTSAPENMLVTSVAGNTFTVQRGAENSQASAFASGAQVVQIITAGVMQELIEGTAAGRIITASGNISMLNTDGIVEINQAIPSSVDIITPPVPIQWKEYTIKDGGGNAGIYPLTIIPSTGTIDGQASWPLAAPYGSVIFYSNGTNLRVKNP